MTNRFGVDTEYFKRELAVLSKSLPNRTPDELYRYLIRLANVAMPPKSELAESPDKKQQTQPKICLRCYGTGWISIPSMNSVPCSCSQTRKLRAGA